MSGLTFFRWATQTQNIARGYPESVYYRCQVGSKYFENILALAYREKEKLRRRQFLMSCFQPER
ncbi:MAG: hypothetical protein U5L09_04560 [Bacteroidales bacterium]|nr:hypothetical protein [Bacteroidales bacterium]